MTAKGWVGVPDRSRLREARSGIGNFVEAWASPHPVSLREPNLSRKRERQYEDAGYPALAPMHWR